MCTGYSKRFWFSEQSLCDLIIKNHISLFQMFTKKKYHQEKESEQYGIHWKTLIFSFWGDPSAWDLGFTPDMIFLLLNCPYVRWKHQDGRKIDFKWI